MKNKKCRIRYEQETDSYYLEFYSEHSKEWETQSRFPCVASWREGEDGEKDFVHFSLLEQLLSMIDNGYHLVIK